MRNAVWLLVLLATTTPSTAGTLERLRGVTPVETSAIHHLLARSATARALAAEIESSDLIVYVQLTAEQAAGRGATRLVAATPRERYLRIVLGAATHPAERGALLAHELQHAVEIARAREVRGTDDLRRLYERIGDDPRAQFAFETAAARDTADNVQREMHRADREQRVRRSSTQD